LLLNTLKNHLIIRSDFFNNKENFYLNHCLFNKTNTLNSLENKTKLCFLFSINLSTECVLLNVKLRIKQNQKILIFLLEVIFAIFLIMLNL